MRSMVVMVVIVLRVEMEMISLMGVTLLVMMMRAFSLPLIISKVVTMMIRFMVVMGRIRSLVKMMMILFMDMAT